MRTVSCAVLVVAALACNDTESMSPPHGETEQEGTWLPLDASASFEGKTLAEWGVEWSRWAFLQTTCEPGHRRRVAVGDRFGRLLSSTNRRRKTA